MEALVVKFSILAGLFGILGLIGLAALLASAVFLVVRVANFDSVLPALLCVVVSIALTAGGLFLTPAPEVVHMEPLTAPVEAALEAARGQLARLKDTGPWARFFQKPPEGGAAEMEQLEAVRTSAPGGERVLVDETLGGWRVRLALPREWKDLCVVENNGTCLSFYQKTSMQDYGGLVFFLTAAENPVDLEAPEFRQMDGARIAAETEGAALISAGPTDVQFDNQSEEIADEYQRMQSEISGILSTVEFERV